MVTETDVTNKSSSHDRTTVVDLCVCARVNNLSISGEPDGRDDITLNFHCDVYPLKLSGNSIQIIFGCFVIYKCHFR